MGVSSQSARLRQEVGEQLRVLLCGHSSANSSTSTNVFRTRSLKSPSPFEEFPPVVAPLPPASEPPVEALDAPDSAKVARPIPRANSCCSQNMMTLATRERTDFDLAGA